MSREKPHQTAMFAILRDRKTLFSRLAVAGFVLVLSGCLEAPQFRPAMVYMLKVQNENNAPEPLTVEQQGSVRDILAALFGTPDDPHVPALADVDVSAALNERLVRIAAGKVEVDDIGRPTGLYRQHCAHCHGVTGDGRGPTAPFLNPYPRDYRMGLFKFKSTAYGEQPTDEDLRRVLIEGIPGTAMPSFRLLTENEINSLVQYVKYLSIRGEVERRLIAATYALPTAGESLISLNLLGDEKSTKLQEQKAEIQQTLSDVIEKWLRASDTVTRPEKPPFDLQDPQVINRGRKLFYTETANCYSCHGDTALGDGTKTNFDDWSAEIAGKTVADMEKNMQQVREYLAAGALEPRPIMPRNLRQGVYRGGRRPLDVYWRVHNGIRGTPMPAASMKPEGAPPDAVGLTTEDVWSLVAYVQSLPYEAVSRPLEQLENQGFTR